MMLLDDVLHSPTNDIEALFFGGISLAVEPCAEAYAAFLKEN